MIAATENFADDSLVDYEFVVTAVPKSALRERFLRQLYFPFFSSHSTVF